MIDRSDTPLSRYVRIIETVGAATDGLTLSNIARIAGLQIGTAHRLVNALRDIGMLSMADGTRSYILGHRLMRLLHTAALPSAAVSTARPYLRELVSEFGETAFMARLVGTSAETVALEQPAESFRSFVHPGREFPLHSTATGKVLLAFQDREFVDRILAQPRVRFTENTCVDETELRRQLDQVRATGFAVCDNEMDLGILTYACPLKLDGKHVFYAIGVVGLGERMRHVQPEAFRRSIAAAAAAMAARAIGVAA